MTGSLMGLLTGRRAPVVRLPDSLVLADRTIPLLVREHPSAKRIVMRLAPGGTAVRLTVPRRTSAKLILSFLERHRGWVVQRIAAVPALQRVEPGMTLPFRGEDLAIVQDPARRATRLEPAEAGAPTRLLVGGEPGQAGRRVQEFLKREARRDLQAAVDRHAAAVGLRPRAMALKDTVSRWGSCTADRRLSFSWRIVMAPPFALDYLAAHEVAHLREMNHGPAFWSLCREICPDMDRGRAWLKTQGSRLHGFDFGPGVQSAP